MPEPELAGAELEGEDSRNEDGTEDGQNTKKVDWPCISPLTPPVTAVPVMKANTPNHLTKLTELKTEVRTQYFVFVGQQRTMVGTGSSVTPVINGHIWNVTTCLRGLPRI